MNFIQGKSNPDFLNSAQAGRRYVALRMKVSAADIENFTRAMRKLANAGVSAAEAMRRFVAVSNSMNQAKVPVKNNPAWFRKYEKRSRA